MLLVFCFEGARSCFYVHILLQFMFFDSQIYEGEVDSFLFSIDLSHIEQKRNGGVIIIQGMVQIVYLHILMGIDGIAQKSHIYIILPITRHNLS